MIVLFYCLMLLVGTSSSQLTAQIIPNDSLTFPGQHSFCGLERALNGLFESKAGFEEHCQESCSVLLEQVFRNATNPIDSFYHGPFKIPVVFHVIYGCEGAVENIPDQRMYNALDRVNEDYQGVTACGSICGANCTTVDTNNVGCLDIEFVLAEKDPNGYPTSGITRTQSNLTYQGLAGETDLKELINWPRNQYLNIYIVNKVTYGDISGLAYYPEVSHDNPLLSFDDDYYLYDGVTMAYWAVDPIDPNRANFAYILSHEIGHWLGLRHIWGDSNDTGLPSNCGSDDFDFAANFLNNHPSAIPDTSTIAEALADFNDTPNTVGHYISYPGINSCVPVGEENTCNDPGETVAMPILDMYDNVMDYTPCAKMFSTGQSHYMKSVLNSSVSDRNFLYDSTNLANTYYDVVDFERAVFTEQAFVEDRNNIGVFTNGIDLHLIGLDFNITSGELPNTDYTISNLPTGLTPRVEVYAADSATLFLDGMADVHEMDNTILFAFLPSAFVSATNVPSNNLSKILDLDFIEASGLVYQNFDGQYSIGPDAASYELVEIDFGYFDFYYNSDGTYAIFLNEGLPITVSEDGVDAFFAQEFNPNQLVDDSYVYSKDRGFAIPTDNLMDGDYFLVGFRIEDCGQSHRYGWMRFEMKRGNSCDELFLKDWGYNSIEGDFVSAGILAEPTLLFSQLSLEESFDNDGIFSDINLSLDGLGAMEGFDLAHHGQVLPTSLYTINTSAVPAGFDLNDLQIEIIDYQTATLSLVNPIDLENSDDFSIELQFDFAAFSNTLASSNLGNTVSNILIDFVGPYQYDFVYKDQADITPSSGDFQSYTFPLEAVEEAPLVEFGFEYYGDGYILYSPSFSSVKVEILCLPNDSLHLQFFNQATLDSLNIDQENFSAASIGAFYSDTNQPFANEIFFTDAELANWPETFAYFLMKVTVGCGEAYYSWIQMRIYPDGSIEVSFIVNNTEPNTILDVFPVCDSYAINPNDLYFVWSEGIEMAGIATDSNAYDPSFGYSNYNSDYLFSLEQGLPYDLDLYGGGFTNTYNHKWYVWIDYNKDGLFLSDSIELVVDTFVTAANYTTITNSIVPRTDFPPGIYNMRVAINLNDSFTGCDVFSIGEVEDYLLELMPMACDSVPPPAPIVSYPFDSLCIDGLGGPDSIVLLSDTLPIAYSQAGYTWQWQVNGLDIVGANEQSLVIDSAAIYSVYFLELDGNPCNSAISDTIDIFATNCYNCLLADTVPLFEASDSIWCLGDSLLLSTDSLLDSTYRYQWQLNGIDLVGENGPSLQIDSIGFYNVYYQDTSETTCVSMLSDTFFLNEDNCFTCEILDSIPEIFSNSNTFCNGDSIWLSCDRAPIGYVYQWQYNGQSLADTGTQNLQVDTAGFYNVYYWALEDSTCVSEISDTFFLNETANCNCTIIDSILPIYFSGLVLCPGDSIWLSTDSLLDSTYTYQWQFNGNDLLGENADSLLVDSIGAYSVYYQDTSNTLCTSLVSSPFNLNQGTNCVDPCSIADSIPIIYSISDTLCEGDSLWLSADDLPNNYTYQWQYEGVDIVGADSQYLQIDTTGFYALYFKEIGDSTCTSNFLDTLVVNEGNCIVSCFQSIDLNSGWNLISFNCLPPSLEMEDIFSDLVLNVVQVKDLSGTYIPAFNFNDIGLWDMTKGYQVKIINPVNLSFTGTAIDPADYPLQLNQGWNMIGYLSQNPEDPFILYNGINGEIIQAKDLLNTFIPSFNFNGIGDFGPTKGYQVKMESDQIFVYPNN